MTNIQIPPGLTDSHIELFEFNGEPMGTHDGSVKTLFELPDYFLSDLELDLKNNLSAGLALELSGYKSHQDKLKKYVLCRFGNFDNQPDYKYGQFNPSEYYNCGFRGNCAMEGIVCSSIKFNGRVISPFEIEMIKLLATEDTLPVIAEKLNVSMNNFEAKKKLLFEKLEVLSRARLVAVSYESQIIQPC